MASGQGRVLEEGGLAQRQTGGEDRVRGWGKQQLQPDLEAERGLGESLRWGAGHGAEGARPGAAGSTTHSQPVRGVYRPQLVLRNQPLSFREPAYLWRQESVVSQPRRVGSKSGT